MEDNEVKDVQLTLIRHFWNKSIFTLYQSEIFYVFLKNMF